MEEKTRWAFDEQIRSGRRALPGEMCAAQRAGQSAGLRFPVKVLVGDGGEASVVRRDRNDDRR